MDLRELHYLLALAEEKSISRAAERLFMAQSSLSQFLSSTEAHLGYRLFIRTSSGIRPTEPGKRMIRFAQDTVKAGVPVVVLSLEEFSIDELGI